MQRSRGGNLNAACEDVSVEDIGPDFPYRRGDTPIFNFEYADDCKLIDTIPNLVRGVYNMVDRVNEQNKVTTKFSDIFANCEICKWKFNLLFAETSVQVLPQRLYSHMTIVDILML